MKQFMLINTNLFKQIEAAYSDIGMNTVICGNVHPALVKDYL